MDKAHLQSQITVFLLLLACIGMAVACGGEREPHTTPQGQEKSTRTQGLELGAQALQSNAPVAAMDIYVVGFHPMKDDPTQQMEAHHFCRQVNEDFAQCTLFDGNTSSANLNGIEYIISEKLFATLPEEERQYWHPHNYEILSGQLMAPGLPATAEKALMRSKMNSYGKTWHVWHTGSMGQGAQTLPLGPPMLAWSFNRDGEANPELVEQRDARMGLDTTAVRRQRQDLAAVARPQEGVDALAGWFAGSTQPLTGVIDAGNGPVVADAAPMGVPTQR